MNRREVLKWMGAAPLIVFLDPSPSGILRSALLGSSTAGAQPRGTQYRGAPGGDIHVSKDGGRTWDLHARFGSQYTVTSISQGASGQVIADVDYQGWPIRLALSKNGGFWEVLA